MNCVAASKRARSLSCCSINRRFSAYANGRRWRMRRTNGWYSRKRATRQSRLVSTLSCPVLLQDLAEESWSIFGRRMGLGARVELSRVLIRPARPPYKQRMHFTQKRKNIRINHPKNHFNFSPRDFASASLLRYV